MAQVEEMWKEKTGSDYVTHRGVTWKNRRLITPKNDRCPTLGEDPFKYRTIVAITPTLYPTPPPGRVVIHGVLLRCQHGQWRARLLEQRVYVL